MVDIHPLKYVYNTGAPVATSEFQEGDKVSLEILPTGPNGVALDSQVVHNFGDESNLAGNKSWDGVHTHTNATPSVGIDSGAIVLQGADAGIGLSGAVNAGLDSSFNTVVVGAGVGGVQIPQSLTPPTFPLDSTPNTLRAFNDKFSNGLSWVEQTGGLVRDCQPLLGYSHLVFVLPMAGTNVVYENLGLSYWGGNLL